MIFKFSNSSCWVTQATICRGAPFLSKKAPNPQLCRGPEIFQPSFPPPTQKLRPRGVVTCPRFQSLELCFWPHEATLSITPLQLKQWMNLIYNTWKFLEWHWNIPIILHKMTAFWSQYTAVFEARELERMKEHSSYKMKGDQPIW